MSIEVGGSYQLAAHVWVKVNRIVMSLIVLVRSPSLPTFLNYAESDAGDQHITVYALARNASLLAFREENQHTP